MTSSGINCPICERDNAEFVLWGRDRLLAKEGRFRLVRCRGCGLLYLNPQPGPEELAGYYPQEYLPYAQEEAGSPLERWLRSYGLAKRCRLVARWKEGGRLLDIGCATGLFLAQMRMSGNWGIQGVEISEFAARYAREHLGLEVFQGELEEAEFADACFDVVTMWDVLEHLLHPLAALREVYRILKPDGLLVLRLPNVESLDARLFGPFWAGLDTPRHLFVFSGRTAEALLGKAGFQVAQTLCLSGSQPAFALSLGMLMDEKLSPPRLGQFAKAAVSHPLVRALTAPYFYLLDRLRRGPLLVIVARKEPPGRVSRFYPRCQ